MAFLPSLFDHSHTAAFLVVCSFVSFNSYEDIVNDTPGIAKAIIAAAGLPWNPEVLNFHKKKHAVNTLSTTQVRKGIYTDAVKAWMRYEKQLEPLVTLLGDNVIYPLKTTLPGYDFPN